MRSHIFRSDTPRVNFIGFGVFLLFYLITMYFYMIMNKFFDIKNRIIFKIKVIKDLRIEILALGPLQNTDYNISDSKIHNSARWITVRGFCLSNQPKYSWTWAG